MWAGEQGRFQSRQVAGGGRAGDRPVHVPVCPVWALVPLWAVVTDALPVPTFRNGLALNLHPLFLSRSSRGAVLL